MPQTQKLRTSCCSDKSIVLPNGGGGGLWSGLTVQHRSRGSVSAPGTHRASFFDHYPPVPVFAPTSPNNLEYLHAVSKNLAHPLHPVHDDGKGGGWKWWE